MLRGKNVKYFKVIAIMIAMCLIAPLNVQASGNLYQDVMIKLIEQYDREFIEVGGFRVSPTTNSPTNSFEAEFDLIDGEIKLYRLYSDSHSTYAPPEATKVYRTVAYQYWVTPSKEDLNNIPAHTRPLNCLDAQAEWTNLVKSTQAYQNGQYSMKERITIPRATLEAEIGSWIDTTPYIYQTAVIEIYNPQTGESFDKFNVGLFGSDNLVGHVILGLDELKTKAQQHEFSESIANEWYTRTKFIELKPKTDAPDFTPTSNKTYYEGNPGDTVKLEVDLNNIGKKEGTTDFIAIDNFNKTYLSEKNIKLDADKSKNYNINATIPQVGQETKITFKANTDGKTPEEELIQDNNELVITLTAIEASLNRASLEISEKRITKAFDLNDIGGVKRVNLEYEDAGYHTYSCGDEDCESCPHKCYYSVVMNDGYGYSFNNEFATKSNEYNYVVNHRNQLNEKLVGTVEPFEPNYNNTDSTLGTTGRFGSARASGGTDGVNPNMSYVVWRGQDMPTIASYKESNNHDLLKLGLKIGKIPQNDRNNIGGYGDNFNVKLGTDGIGKYITHFQCSGSCGGESITSQTHYIKNEPEYEVDVNILTYIGEQNTGAEAPSADTNGAFKANGVSFNNSQTGGLYGKSSGFPIRDESKKLEFHPYVQMAFDYPYDKDNIQGTKAVNVLAQHKSTIIPTDFVNVGWVRSVNPTINISSNQWLKHKRAEKYGKDATLPGGAMYQLDTKGNSSKVAVTTWQHYLAQEQQAALINDGSYFTLSNANTRHNDLVAETKESLNTLDVEQYVHPRDNVANAFEGGSKVKGKGQNMSIEGRTFKLSTFDKHHLVYNSNKNSKNVAEADIDIISENSSRTYYKVYADVDGNVYVQKSTNGSSWATLDKLPKSQNASSLGNAESIELDNKTKIVTNLINALDRNKGNDPSVGNGPQWYNEAWDGIFVVKSDTILDVGLNEPAHRVSILDPRLTPPQASQYDLYTKAYSSQFRLNTKSYSNINKPEGYIGKFGDVDIILPEMMNMHYSKMFYIPSGTVEDNIYIN